MPDESPDETQALRDALNARERELAAATARASAVEETLQAFTRQPQQQAPQPAPGKSYVIPPHIRQQIAAAGLADAEIESNGDLIVPFINAYLGQAAAEVLQLVQGLTDEITMLHMVRDGETYPHANDVFNDIKKVRADEAKAGRYMAPDVAYRIAVANNHERLAGEGDGSGQFTVRAAPTNPVTIRSRDVAASSGLRTMRAPAPVAQGEPRSADDLTQMSREERRAFFEQHGSTPIR